MDKAILTADDIAAILAWRDENPDVVRRSRAPLRAIEIVCPGGTVRAFRTDRELTLYLKRDGRSLGYVRFCQMPDGMWREGKSTLDIPRDGKQSMLTVYGSLMALMVHGNENIAERPKARERTVPNCGRQRQAKGKPGVVYILRRGEGALCISAQNSHASPRFAFTVRGHWRRYKSGKQIWISEYRKGAGKPRGTTYKPGFAQTAN